MEGTALPSPHVVLVLTHARAQGLACTAYVHLVTARHADAVDAATASTDVPESDSEVGESADSEVAAMDEDVASPEAFCGRIYRISAPGCDRVYVGSTRSNLGARLSRHQRNRRAWQRGVYPYVTSFALVGLPRVSIDIIEEEEYQDLQHMRDREAYWIARLRTVNRHTPGRSDAESRRISNAVRVPCGTCGKLVRRSHQLKHQLTRACIVAAFNRRENAASS